MKTTVVITATEEEDKPLTALSYTLTRQQDETLADFLQRIRESIIDVTMDLELKRERNK